MKSGILLKSLTILSLLSLQPLCAQVASFEWAKRMGGASNDEGYGIAVDASGNVYTTGRFAETANFNEGETNLTSVGGGDIFVQKLDSNGDLLWVRQMGGNDDDVGVSIAVDVNGNVYTAGAFNGTVDFNPGSGTAILTSAGDWDMFVQKLDPNGNFLWAKRMGGTSVDRCMSIAVDGSGNVYTTGYFLGTTDLDPGSEAAIFTSNGMYDIFIQKLNTHGDFQWAKQIGGLAWDFGSSIAVDASGNVYSTGSFSSKVYFDPAEGAPYLTAVAGGEDTFILKLDTDGNFQWVRQIRGSGQDMGMSIAVDAVGNTYTTGFFEGVTDFNPGEGTHFLTAYDISNVFVLKLNKHGYFQWAKQMGGIEWDQGNSIAVDAYGDVYTTGQFQEQVPFGQGPESFYLTSAGYEDVFIHKYNTHGNFKWVKQMGGIYGDVGHSIAVDGSGNIYTTGYFGDTVDFDPGAGTTTLTSAGANDIFVQKLSQPGYIPVSVSKAAGLSDLKMAVYPNPSSGIFNIVFEKPIDHAVLTITDIQGKLISITQIHNASEARIELNETPGVYLLTIKSKGGQKTIQLIKE